MERKKTAFLHAHAVQLLLWTWYPADYNENVDWCPTKRRGHNEAFNDENSIYYHRDRLNETAFILGKNQYGRIIYNNRYVDPDSQMWYYGRHVYNFINCEVSECKEKMFFEKNPDYVYRQLMDLR